MLSKDLFSKADTPLCQLHDPLFIKKGVELWVKRDDLIHAQVSGNKWRKLKYNFIDAEKKGYRALLTFGGAFSNHIYALAAAAKAAGFQSTGIIRGEPAYAANPTLSFAQQCGMQLHFVDRTTYKLRNDEDYLEEVKQLYPDAYLIPEGGTNEMALQGVAEISRELPADTSHVCVAAGTGGTLAGLVKGAAGKHQVVGFPVLKADLRPAIDPLVPTDNRNSFELIAGYHFGGYARVSKELVNFMDRIEQSFSVPLEPVYTAKMFYGLFDLIAKGYFPAGSKIVAIHTGGLQGLEGMKKKMASLRS